MNIRLIVVGKTDQKYLQTGIDDYVGRLGHYCKFELIALANLKNAATLSPQELKEREGDIILKNIQPTDHVVLLDEKGDLLTSMEMSRRLQQSLNAGTRTLVFVVGGAFGFAPKVYQRANSMLSLSRMTFNHQMVRLFFVEQLYRAFTILRGEKYHNE